MLMNIFVGVMCALCASAVIFVWWLENRGNSKKSSKENDLDESHETASQSQEKKK